MIDPLTLNDWHPVRMSEQVSTKPLKTRLLGTDIVIARDANGTLTGTVLPRGQAADECLLVERYGFVWATLGRPSKPLFELPEFGDGRGRRFVPWGAIGVHTSAPRMVENFVDQGHFAFVHTGILGIEPHTEIADCVVEHDRTTNELWAKECHVYQPKPAATVNEPSVVTYRYRIVRPWAVLFYKSSVIHPDLDNISGLYVQQVEEDLSIAHPFAYHFPGEKSRTQQLHYSQEIFGQDRPILQSQVPKKLPLSIQAEKPTRADRFSVAFRRWLLEGGVSYGVVRP